MSEIDNYHIYDALILQLGSRICIRHDCVDTLRYFKNTYQ